MEKPEIKNPKCFAITDIGELDSSLEITKYGKGNKLKASFTNKTNSKLKLFSIIVADFRSKINADEILEHGFLQKSLSAFQKSGHITRESRYFMKLNSNHFSFLKEFGYLKPSIVSEWFTVIRTSGFSVVIGALTTGKAFTVIYVKEDKGFLRIRIVCQMDGIKVAPGESAYSEEIFFSQGDEDKIMKTFAEGIAKEMDVRFNRKQITAVCSAYYWNGNNVDEKIVFELLETISKKKIDLDYVQLDAGYSRHWGDWLDVLDRFPKGLKHAADNIKKKGMSAGIWISPFVASKKSRLFREHPGWFIKDEKGKFIEGLGATPFDNLIPDMSLRVIDLNNKDAVNHLIGIIKKMKSYGFSMFKFDFMYPVFMHLSKDNNDNLTRVEAFRGVFKKIKNAAGKSYLMSAISPLSPLVGIIDSARIGIDSSFPTYLPIITRRLNRHMLESNLQNAKIRAFLNNIIWHNDVDCLLLHKRHRLSKKDIDEHKAWILKNGSSLWLGDDIASLEDEKLEEIRKLISKFRRNGI